MHFLTLLLYIFNRLVTYQSGLAVNCLHQYASVLDVLMTCNEVVSAPSLKKLV